MNLMFLIFIGMAIWQQANPAGMIFTSTAGYQAPIQPPPYSLPKIAPSYSTLGIVAPQYTSTSSQNYFR